MRSYIDIDRLLVYARHGVDEQERRVGNAFEVSLRLYYDITAAADDDDIALAINYAEVVDVVNAVMVRPCLLLETVVMHIRQAIADRWPGVTGGRITLAKVHPPIKTPMASVAVTVEW